MMLTRPTAVDTSEGLFAEFIYQVCTDEEEYREFLDLPLNMWLRHPLCVSVAHKVHGKSMATGWPRHPADLSERDGAKNNILFETWTSNAAKMDMEKQSCDDLRAEVKTIKLARPDWYNKTVDNATHRSSDGIFEPLTAEDFEQESLYTSVEVVEDQVEEEDQMAEEDQMEEES